jgi:transcriptional regulator with XRE-family HTH domain
MLNCTECGGERVQETLLPAYETDLGGIRVRLVNSVTRIVCEDCGDGAIEIPDLDGLAKAAALVRALVPFRFTGKEVRFLRLALDMTGREFADAMELAPETVSRWENGGRGVGGYSEKLLRHNICALLHNQVSAIDYEPADITRMRVLNAPEDFELPPLEFRRVVMKENHETAEAWDRLTLPMAA